ncbi:hypothetical protein, partial [Parapedobacter indicus]|uniref:hypothetical protein n=1 Tax=Parapedobacter indicus TaxID=1477437 RepID=UPI000B87965F
LSVTNNYMRVDAVHMMKVGPSVSEYRFRYQTTAKLLGLNVPVVSVVGKGIRRCQVSDGKANVSEPPMRRRKDYLMSEPMSSIIIGISMEGTCLLSMRHPAYRRRDPMGGVCMERENLSWRCEGKTPSGGHRKGESTDALHGGGTLRSSDEVPVMGMERRGRIIWPISMRETAEGAIQKQEVPK